MLEIVTKVIRTLFIKLNLSPEETDEMIEKLRERKVGELFENFEKVDFQLERRLRADAEEKAAESEKKATNAEEMAANAKQENDNFKRLTQKLLDTRRLDDLSKASQDEAYLKQLYKEFGIK